MDLTILVLPTPGGPCNNNTLAINKYKIIHLNYPLSLLTAINSNILCFIFFIP